MYPPSLLFINSIFEECMKRGGKYLFIRNFDNKILFFFIVVVYPCPKGTADGTYGDHLVIAPPFTITEKEIVFLVDSFKESIDVVFNSTPGLL